MSNIIPVLKRQPSLREELNQASLSLTVKQLWVRFPSGFDKYDEFYKCLGNDIPKYCIYDGGRGVQHSYCVSKYLNVSEVCKDFGIEDYKTVEFLIEEDNFNNKYEIHTNYATWGVKDSQPYTLVKSRH